MIDVHEQHPDVHAARDAVKLVLERCLPQGRLIEVRGVIVVTLDEFGERLEYAAGRPGGGLEPAEPDHIWQLLGGSGGQQLLFVKGFDDLQVDVGIGFLECLDPAPREGIGLRDTETPFDEITRDVGVQNGWRAGLAKRNSRNPAHPSSCTGDCRRTCRLLEHVPAGRASIHQVCPTHDLLPSPGRRPTPPVVMGGDAAFRPCIG